MNLDHLNVGDKVIVWSGWDSTPAILPIEKVLKVHLVVGGTKYQKSNGYQIRGPGCGYVRGHLEPITDESMLAVKEREFKNEWHRTVNKARNINWSALSIEQLKAVMAIVEPTQE